MKDFEFRKITTGVTSIKKTYEESIPLIEELQKLRIKYPHAIRELQIDFLYLICKAEENYKFIHKISSGGKFTLNGRKSLQGWIKKEFDNILNWVKNSQSRKQLLFDFLTGNPIYLDLQKKCFEEKTVNLPIMPNDKNDFDEWLRKYRSKNRKEVEKILIKPDTE